MSEWISVNDRLPEDGAEVFCCGHEYNDKSKPWFYAMMKYENGFKWYDYSRERWSIDTSDYIEYWATPEPPK